VPFTDARRRRLFTIDANVVLPDHLHSVWTLPSGDGDSSTRQHAIKARFSARIPKDERLSRRRVRNGERGIWQRRFREHKIRDEDDLQTDAAGCALRSFDEISLSSFSSSKSAKFRFLSA